MVWNNLWNSKQSSFFVKPFLIDYCTCQRFRAWPEKFTVLCFAHRTFSKRWDTRVLSGVKELLPAAKADAVPPFTPSLIGSGNGRRGRPTSTLSLSGMGQRPHRFICPVLPSPEPRRGHWTLVKCMKLISQQFCCYHDYSVGLFKPQALPLLYTNTKLNNKRITKTQLRGIAHNAESSSAVYSSNSGAKLGFFIDATNQALVIFKGKIKQ